VIGPRVRAQDRPVVALPAAHVERPQRVSLGNFLITSGPCSEWHNADMADENPVARRNVPGSSFRVTIAGVESTWDVAIGSPEGDLEEVRRASGTGEGDRIELVGELRTAEADERGLEPGKAKR
jgi:hypothetical protein